MSESSEVQQNRDNLLAEQMLRLVDAVAKSNTETARMNAETQALIAKTSSDTQDLLKMIAEALINANKKVEIVEPQKEKSTSPKVDVNKNKQDDVSVDHDDDLTNITDAFKTPTTNKKEGKSKKDENPPKTLDAKIRAVDITNPNTPAITEISSKLGYEADFNDRPTLEQVVEFKASRRLSTKSQILDILLILEDMNFHYASCGQRVYFRQVMDRPLQVLMASAYLENNLDRLYKMKEQNIFVCLLSLLAPSTKMQILNQLEQYKPSAEFIAASLRVQDFHKTLVPQIIMHITRFSDLFEALIANDPSPESQPPVFKKPGQEDKRTVHKIFLNSFPHRMGDNFEQLFDIKDKKTFQKYIGDFKEKLSIHAATAKSAETLVEVLNKLHGTRKGDTMFKENASDKAKSSKPVRFERHHELSTVSPQMVTRILKHEEEMEDLHSLNQNTTFNKKKILTPQDKSKLGCFYMAQGKPCKDGSNCKYSHKKEDLRTALQKLEERTKHKVEQLAQRKKTFSLQELHTASDSEAYETTAEDEHTSRKIVTAVGPDYFSESDDSDDFYLP